MHAGAIHQEQCNDKGKKNNPNKHKNTFNNFGYKNKNAFASIQFLKTDWKEVSKM